jgi:hypothetical protein
VLLPEEECRKGYVRTVDCIIGAPVVIEELSSWAEKHRKGSIECGMG